MKFLKQTKPLKLMLAGLLLGVLVPAIVQASVNQSENTVIVDPIQNPAVNEEANSCNWVTHTHRYYNVSENVLTREFRAVVYNFAIVLEDDFWSNMDTSSLECTDGDGIFQPCYFNKSNIQDGDIILSSNAFGGTEVTYQESLDWIDGSPRGLLWTYGTSLIDSSGNFSEQDMYSLPWVEAANNSYGKRNVRIEEINFYPENFSSYQEATTQSWTKVQYHYYRPRNRSDVTQYTPTYPIEVDTDNNGTDDVGVDPDGDYIYWYGINGTEKTTWEACDEPVTCTDLSITPESGNPLGVDDLYGTTGFIVRATGSDGSNLSNDLEYNYQAYAYGAQPGVDRPNASGRFRRSKFGFRLSNDITASSPEMYYGDSFPGDQIYVEAVGYEEVCNDILEFPYCTDLEFLSPQGNLSISGTAYEDTLEIEATASTGEDWPYDVTYDSTDSSSEFSEGRPPVTTTSWIMGYRSTNSGTVSVQAEDDIAAACSDAFTYTITPPVNTCEDLTIVVPSTTITEADMEAGEVEITWESTMTDGSDAVGPWEVTSTNPNGSFRDGGQRGILGSITTIENTVYYIGEPGDSITVTDTNYASCTDSIDSEGDTYCTELLPEDIIIEQNGSTQDIVIDFNNPSDIEDLYSADTDRVCLEFTIQTSPDYIGVVSASNTDSSGNYAGDISLSIQGQGNATSTNAPASLPIGYEQATEGIVCIERFQPTDTLSIETLPDQNNACNYTLPLPPEDTYICEDLTLDPDTGDIVMAASDTDAGVIEGYVYAQVSSNNWDGTLVIEANGSGTLYYADGTAGGTRLEYARNGSSEYEVEFTYEGGGANDSVEAYIVDETVNCYDSFTIEQERPDEPEVPVACIDLEMDPDSYTMSATDTDAGVQSFTVDITGADPTWSGTVVVERVGIGELFYSDGSASNFADGHLEIPTSGDVSVVGFTYEGGDAADIITAYVRNEADACYDDFVIYQETDLPDEEEYVCYGIEMDPSSYTISGSEAQANNVPITIFVNGEHPDWTGVLVAQVTGTGTLTDETGRTALQGSILQTNVSGTETILSYTYNGGSEGDRIEFYVTGSEDTCYASFPIEQEEPSQEYVCEDLSISPENYTISQSETTTGDLEITVTVNGEHPDWTGTLIGQFQGTGDLLDANGNSGFNNYVDGHHEIAVSGTETVYVFTYRNGGEDDVLDFFIQNERAACEDNLRIDRENGGGTPENPDNPGGSSGGGGGGSRNVCQDVEFSIDQDNVIRGEDYETEIEVRSQLNNQELVITYNCEGEVIRADNGAANYSSDDGELRITDVDGDETFNVTFTDVCEDPEISAYIDGHENACYDDLELDVLSLGEFRQYIFTFNFTVEKSPYTDEGVFFSHDDDRAFYTLEYEPVGGEEAISFTNDLWGNNVRGVLGTGAEAGQVNFATSYSELTESGEFEYGTIRRFGFGEQHEEDSNKVAAYAESFTKENFMTFVPYIKYDDGRESEVIEACEYDEEANEDGGSERGELRSTEVCFDPEETPEDDQQVVIENAGTVEEGVIRVRFVGVVDSSELKCDSADDECLTLQFENNAEVEVYEELDPLTAKAQLVVLCSYLVTRGGADVYLEVPLSSGSDVSCIFRDEDERTSSDFRNVDSLVILENPETSSTSSSSETNETSSTNSSRSSFADSTISLCDDDERSNSVIGNLSSYVCEIVTGVSDLWKRSSIEATTESNVQQAIRNVDTNQANNKFNDWNSLYNELSNKNNPNSGILYYQGSGEGDTLTLGGFDIPAGAWTLIVEDATLVLNGNIGYESTTNFNNLPSMAFVVLDGDIYIERSAKTLVGVYYTNQSFDGAVRSAVNGDLTITGSVYGHIQPLLDAADYVGSPTIDDGGLVVNYDNRILLNTPPALSEYVDVSSEKAVN